MAEYGLTGPEWEARIGAAYDIALACTGPLLVELALELLEQLHADITLEPGRQIVLTGEDCTLALILRALDPEFFRDHVCVAPLTLEQVQAALHDTTPGDDGPREQLTRYLHERGVPVDVPGSGVTLVDLCDSRELRLALAELYPGTRFTDRSILDVASPCDGAAVALATLLHGCPAGCDSLPLDGSSAGDARVDPPVDEAGPQPYGEAGPQPDGEDGRPDDGHGRDGAVAGSTTDGAGPAGPADADGCSPTPTTPVPTTGREGGWLADIRAALDGSTTSLTRTGASSTTPTPVAAASTSPPPVGAVATSSTGPTGSTPPDPGPVSPPAAAATGIDGTGDGHRSAPAVELLGAAAVRDSALAALAQSLQGLGTTGPAGSPAGTRAVLGPLGAAGNGSPVSAVDGYRDRVARWQAGGEVDPSFAAVADAALGGPDPALVDALRDAVRAARLDLEETGEVWAAFCLTGDDAERAALVEDVLARRP